MDPLHASILILGALASAAGLALLGFSWRRGRLFRRVACIGVPLLPVATFTLWLADGAASPPNHGGFWSAWTILAMMLSPYLLIWLVACFTAYVLGHILRPIPSERSEAR